MSVIENRFQTTKPQSKKILIISVTVLVIAAAIIWALYFWGVIGIRPNKSGWQAVFLTNGQVYFGKLDSVYGRYVKLSDIYYLQVSQPLQPENTNNPEQQPNVNLIKLGDELHGPEDTMYIERKNIMFWENLKSGSSVVKAIEDTR